MDDIADAVNVPLEPTNRLKDLFDEVDKNNDGKVNYRELWSFLRKNNDGIISKSKLKKLHKRADRNHDGTLSFEEFQDLINDPEFSLFTKYMNDYMKLFVPQKPLIRTFGFAAGDSTYDEHYSCWPPKVCMIIISILEIALYVIDKVIVEPDSNGMGPISAGLVYDPYRRVEVWRFLTYMFVHIGIHHLVTNVIVQLFVGLPLEFVNKWWAVLVVYFSGVLIGSLGSSVVDSHSFIAGASGGVYALITAHVACVIMNWNQLRYPLAQILVFIILIIADVTTAITNRHKTGEPISYAAHFFGGLAGLLMGTILLKNVKVTEYEKIFKYTSICLISLLISFTVVYNAVAESHFLKQAV